MAFIVSFNILEPLNRFQVHCMSIRGKIKQLPASFDHIVCKYHENYAKQSLVIISIYTAAATLTDDTSRSLSFAWARQLISELFVSLLAEQSKLFDDGVLSSLFVP